MIEITGKYCKDVKIFTENIEEDALALIYQLADSPMFKGAKVSKIFDICKYIWLKNVKR